MAARVFAVDANVIVAAVCSWHQHHERAAKAIELRLGRGEAMSVPAPALVEAYAVLTRLPAPYRLSPADAWTALQPSFVDGVNVVAPQGPESVSVLRALAKQDIGGGRTYDAIIAECARKAGAQALLTFNTRHFDPAPLGVSIVEP